ncbi:MAG: hypothetical protein ACI3ZC_02310 [Candidatus Cryptobacteroides sp.]
MEATNMTTYVSQSQNTNAIPVSIHYNFGVGNSGTIKCVSSDLRSIIPALVKNKLNGKTVKLRLRRIFNMYEVVLDSKGRKECISPGYQRFETINPCSYEPDYEEIVFVQEKVGKFDVSDDCWNIIRTQDVNPL